MLTPLQQEFVNRRPDSNIVVIPFDPTSNEKFKQIKKEIQSVLGNVEVLHRGSTGLGVAGQPEIDIYIPLPNEEILESTEKMKVIFGDPKSIYPNERTKFIKYIEQTMIEIILVNKTCKSWIDGEIFFNYLENNEEAKMEYDKLKGVGEELSIRDYYIRKFEFMNSILQKASK